MRASGQFARHGEVWNRAPTQHVDTRCYFVLVGIACVGGDDLDGKTTAARSARWRCLPRCRGSIPLLYVALGLPHVKALSGDSGRVARDRAQPSSSRIKWIIDSRPMATSRMQAVLSWEDGGR